MDRLNSRFDAQNEAIKKAETAIEKRFDSVNEFRAVLANQQSMYITKIEVEAKFKSIEEKVNMLYELQLEQKGKIAAQARIWSIFMGALGILGALVGAVATLYRAKL